MRNIQEFYIEQGVIFTETGGVLNFVFARGGDGGWDHSYGKCMP